MNQSDQANPRRLVRAIEVAETKPTKQRLEVYQPTVQLGLQLPIKTVQEKIALRVEQRLEQGIMREVQQFELHHPDKNLQAKQALGYHMILGYLNGHLTLDQLKAVWALEELRYAKRQQTWWKKRPEITWLMGNQAGLEKNAWKIVLSGLEQAGL
jgi:tRNA dimethylallyltransferase